MRNQLIQQCDDANQKRLFFLVTNFLTKRGTSFRHNIKSVSFRSNRQRCSIKKGFLRNFTKFTGKLLCQSLFFNKVAGLRRATLLEKRLWHECFSVNFVKLVRTPFFTEQLWWLLLRFVAESYLGRCQTSLMELFVKMGNRFLIVKAPS